MKILVLTGAGASRNYLRSFDGTPLTTERITNWTINNIPAFVDQYYPHNIDDEKNIIQDELIRIHDSLRKFNPDYNFETFIHLIDLISDLYSQKAVRIRMPTFSNLTNTNYPLIDYFSGEVPLSERFHYHTIPHFIRCYILERIAREHTPINLNIQQWSDFYSSIITAGHNISIADLNYDSLQFRISQNINAAITDYDNKLKNGFEHIPSDNGFLSFNTSNFQAAKNILIHLHGSIYLYQNNLGIYFTTDTDEAIRFRSQFSPTHPNRGQTGTSLHSQFMITGFHKAEAVSQSVFSQYYIRLVKEIDSADAIVLIGYGGGDTHINMLLSQEQYANKRYIIASFAEYHNGNFNTYLSRPSWHYLYNMVPNSLFDQHARMNDFFVSRNNAAFTFKGVDYFLGNFRNIFNTVGITV